MKKSYKFFFTMLLVLLIFLLNGCFPYMYHDREKVLLDNVDVDATLKIADIELAEGGFDRVLTIWALRDQDINDDQAQVISDLYFKYIDNMDEDSAASFSKWHLAWAVSNYYRFGNDDVKNTLEDAFQHAKKVPETLDKVQEIADTHINGEKIYMGDVHSLGRSYARSHIVVPGNEKYLQSFDEYLSDKTDTEDENEK